MASSTIFTAVFTVALLFLATATTTQAQAECASKLVPCGEYLNTTTTPPNTCCSSIKDAVDNDLTCLCNLYNTPGLLQSFGVNVTQALGLTKRCGVTTDLSACKAVSGADAPTVSPPAGVPGNDGSRMAWTGFSSLLLLWATSLFY